MVSLFATPKMVRVRRRIKRRNVEGLSLVLVLERIDLDAGMELSLVLVLERIDLDAGMELSVESLALKPLFNLWRRGFGVDALLLSSGLVLVGSSDIWS